MATTQDIHAPTLGAQGEPCAGCGAPLAGDQRYCLECGARRAQARVAFRDILAPRGAPPPTPPPGLPASAPDGPPARSGLAFLAGLLCLLAALGVGVLIGNAGNDSTAATPGPQVITVGGAAAAPAATAPAATTTAPAADASGTGSTAAKSTKAAKPAKGSTGSKADQSKVKDLNNSSGADYQKKSQKLPKAVGTSGKPAPKDNKPAGGGSGFQDIG
jgi:hypothetical protein